MEGVIQERVWAFDKPTQEFVLTAVVVSGKHYRPCAKCGKSSGSPSDATIASCNRVLVVKEAGMAFFFCKQCGSSMPEFVESGYVEY